MTGLAERLRLFEPLLDELAAEFRLEATGPMESRGDPVSDAYRRCEVKRLRIGQACGSNRGAVLDHADEIMHAIAHDHCPSGNRQLIEPLVKALGARPVMERILVYLEKGSATERLGAAMAWYWAAPTLQYSTLDELQNDPGSSDAVKHSLVPGEVTPSGKNAQARVLTREFRPRIRAACLRASSRLRIRTTAATSRSSSRSPPETTPLSCTLKWKPPGRSLRSIQSGSSRAAAATDDRKVDRADSVRRPLAATRKPAA